MANWEKLNKEFDDALNSMTKEDWDNWYKNVEQKRINQNKMKIVHLINETYQVVDEEDQSVYYQGSQADCEKFIRYEQLRAKAKAKYWTKILLQRNL